MSDDGNTGEIGLASIRINGKRIEDLPFGASQQAAVQLPMFIAHERQQQIKNVLAQYPRVTVEYLQARLKECQTAIKDFARVKVETRDEITRYHGLVHGQQGKKTWADIEPHIEEVQRDNNLTHDEKKARIATLRSDLADYDPAHLREQIALFEANLDRLDEAIQKENDSIAELNGVIAKVQVRDAELRRLGVTTIQ